MFFAYLAVKNDYVTTEDIYKCLDTQGKMAKRGLLFRLSEILINNAYVEIPSIHAIIELQEKFILECSDCSTRYNILGLQTQEFPCKQCDNVLEISDELFEVSNIDEINKFKEELEYIVRREKESVEEEVGQDNLASSSSLCIIREKFTETIQDIAQTRDEDNIDEDDEFEFSCGASETRQEYEDDEDDEDDDEVISGISGSYSKEHAPKMVPSWYKKTLEVNETSSEDSFAEDDSNIVVVSAKTIKRKKDAKDDEDDFVDLAEEDFVDLAEEDFVDLAEEEYIDLAEEDYIEIDDTKKD